MNKNSAKFFICPALHLPTVTGADESAREAGTACVSITSKIENSILLLRTIGGERESRCQLTNCCRFLHSREAEPALA